MRHHIEIGCTPADETCAATGKTDDWSKYQAIECRAFIAALRLKYGPEPEGAQLKTLTNAHDFGSYREVCVYYEDTELAAGYAQRVDRGMSLWEEADFWPPVTYDQHSQAVHVITDPDLWSRSANPHCLTSKDDPRYTRPKTWTVQLTTQATGATEQAAVRATIAAVARTGESLQFQVRELNEDTRASDLWLDVTLDKPG